MNGPYVRPTRRQPFPSGSLDPAELIDQLAPDDRFGEALWRALGKLYEPEPLPVRQVRRVYGRSPAGRS